MSEILILNRIDDAEFCIKNKLIDNRKILTTHASVNIYLKELFKIDSKCMCSLFSNSEIVKTRETLSKKVDSILLELDKHIAPQLNKQFNLNMRYFWPLYSYFGKHHIYMIYFFIEGFKRVICQYQPTKIILCNGNRTDHFEGITNLSDLLLSSFKDVHIEVIETYEREEKIKSIPVKLLNIIRKTIDKPDRAIKKLLDILYVNIKYRISSKNAKTVLLFEPLHDLTFLKRDLNGYNICYYSHSYSTKALGFNNLNKRIKVNVDFGNFEYIENRNAPLIDTFLKDLKADFNKNIETYIDSIECLKFETKDDPVSLAIWGNPPALKGKALIFEYLLSKGVPVIGSQHGCKYGESHVIVHPESDFKRCDYYFSYGFNAEDLERIFPEEKSLCKIIPVGSTKPDYSQAKVEVDIFFPLQHTLAMHKSGMSRVRPDILMERQIKILEYLNSLKRLLVIIKPFAYSNLETCGALTLLKRMPRLKLINHLNLVDCLKIYKPKIAIIEYPSQPLFDCLHTDAEIFLMNDTLSPFEDQALEELCKRVHFSEELDKFIDLVDGFILGKIRPKRNDTFYNHYVHKKNRKSNILQTINNLTQ